MVFRGLGQHWLGLASHTFSLLGFAPLRSHVIAQLEGEEEPWVLSRGQERSSLVSGAGGCLGFSDGLIVPWVCWYFGAEASDHNFPSLLSLLDTLCGLAICIMTQALDDAPLACALSFPLLCAVQRCPGVT